MGQNKDHFLVYGAQQHTVEMISQQLSKAYAFTFQKRSSFYLGNYDKYSGEEVDNLSIRPNFVQGEWINEDHQECQTLIFASFTTGSMKEKNRKKEKLILQLTSLFPDLTLLKDKTF